MNVIFPVNFEESLPPKVSSPFLAELEFVGSKDTETRLEEMLPWPKRLSVTVGILFCIDGDSEPIVRFVGPKLQRMVTFVNADPCERKSTLTLGCRPRPLCHEKSRQRLWTARG